MGDNLKFFKGKQGNFTVVKPTDLDFRQCSELIAKAMGQETVNKEFLEQALKTPNIIILVAKDKEKIVGLTTGLVFPFTTQGSPKGRIDFLSVLDDASAQQGLYDTLIEEFINELRKRIPTARFVDTNVASVNSYFVAMYSLKGFQIIGFTKGETPTTDIVVLRKNISANIANSHTTV